MLSTCWITSPVRAIAPCLTRPHAAPVSAPHLEKLPKPSHNSLVGRAPKIPSVRSRCDKSHMSAAHKAQTRASRGGTLRPSSKHDPATGSEKRTGPLDQGKEAARCTARTQHGIRTGWPRVPSLERGSDARGRAQSEWFPPHRPCGPLGALGLTDRSAPQACPDVRSTPKVSEAGIAGPGLNA